MAVSNFVAGQRYRISGDDLANLQASNYLYASNFKLVYSNTWSPNSSSYIKVKYGCLFINGSNFLIIMDDGETNTLFSDNGGATYDYIEFVANEYTNPDSSIIFKSISTLVSQTGFSQVSIYNDVQGVWCDLPCCSDYTGISTTIVDSGRNTKGVVIGVEVRSDVAKVEMKWNFLTLEQYSYIAQLFEPKYGGSFFNNVSFFDTVKGDFDGQRNVSPDNANNPCRIMYPSDRKVSFAKMKLGDDGYPIGYQNVSLNLIDTGKITGE